MDWKTFRALETFSILYDIQMDEETPEGICSIGLLGKRSAFSTLLERFERVPRRQTPGAIETGDAWPWEGYGYRLRPALLHAEVPLTLCVSPSTRPGSLDASLGVILDDAPRRIGVERVGSASRAVVDYWRMLLSVKLARAELMARAESATDTALDDLGRLLVSSLPPLSPGLVKRQSKLRMRPAAIQVALQLFVLRVLYLNEAAACYRGMQTIVLADECLDLMNSVIGGFCLLGGDPRDQCVYELLAQYNKAQGRLHVRQHDQALDGFLEVAQHLGVWPAPTGESPVEHYFEGTDDIVLAPLRWPETWGLRLFQSYIGVPSILQAADTLGNLQRSGDVQRLLEIHSNSTTDWTEYQSHRRGILLARAALDSGRSVLPEEFPLKVDSKRRRLQLQHLSVRTQAASDLGEKVMLLQSRIALAKRDRVEFDQAASDWVDGIKGCKGITKRLSEVRLTACPSTADPGCGDNEAVDYADVMSYLQAKLTRRGVWPRGKETFQAAAINLVSDPSYRDNKVETRTSLVKSVRSLLELTRPDGHGGEKGAAVQP